MTAPFEGWSEAVILVAPLALVGLKSAVVINAASEDPPAKWATDKGKKEVITMLFLDR